MSRIPLFPIRIAVAAAAAGSLAGCVVYPVHPHPRPVIVSPPPPVLVVEPAPPPGVVYVAPVGIAPAPGYLWRYHRTYGWGWWHPHYGWHAGWR